MHEHHSEEHRKAKSVIRKCAKKTNVTPKQFQHMFVFQKDHFATMLFWRTLYSRFPDMTSYNQIDFCHCCQMFSFSHNPSFQVDLKDLV
jgi:hypothetical protein